MDDQDDFYDEVTGGPSTTTLWASTVPRSGSPPPATWPSSSRRA
jgi:hypothetical protein